MRDEKNMQIACTEVLEILKYVSESDYKKIPKNVIVALEKNKIQGMTYLYNPWKSLKEQKISKTGKELLAVLYKNYWTTENQNKKINAYQNKKRAELQSQNTYVDIFKDKQHNNNDDVTEIEETQNLVVYKEGKLKKIIIAIKKFFKLK